MLNDYLRCSTTPEAIHAACEDYRAAASIDLEHDAHNREVKIACPLLLLWAKNGLIGKHFKPMEIWQEWATDIAGHPMNCGYFIPEELPEETYQILNNWLKSSS